MVEEEEEESLIVSLRSLSAWEFATNISLGKPTNKASYLSYLPNLVWKSVTKATI